MKNLMVLLPLLICSCTKKDTHSKMITKDSTEIPDQRSVEYPTDSSKGVVLSSNDEPDKNEMAKIKFNDHGILEFLGFEEIKKA